MSSKPAENVNAAIRIRNALVLGLFTVMMIASAFETAFCAPTEGIHGFSQHGCCTAPCATGYASGEAAQAASPCGETDHSTCGSSAGETAFDTYEWEGFPPKPVQVLPAPGLRKLPCFFVLSPYRGSLLEPLDPPPRLI